MKIARKLKTDRRAKMTIRADVLATKVILQVNNMSLKLSHVEARRVANTLDKAVNIQTTRRGSRVVSSNPNFSKQVLVEPEVVLPELTTLERRLELCRYIYKIIKEKHYEIPKFNPKKIKVHSINTCDGGLGSALAHAHPKYKHSKFSQQICLKQKYLLNPIKEDILTFNSVVDSLANTVAHEIGHLMIKSCRHCEKWRLTYEKFHKTIKEVIQSGEFHKNLPLNLKE